MSLMGSVASDRLVIGHHVLESRLIVGTGRYESFELMREAVALAGAVVSPSRCAASACTTVPEKSARLPRFGSLLVVAEYRRLLHGPGCGPHRTAGT